MLSKTMTVMFFIFALTGIGCKKDEVNELAKQEIFQKKIADIIPKEYQDSLVKMGIVINQDLTPPKIEGAFILKPLKLVKSNIPNDRPTMTFADLEIKFFGQDADNNIKLISRTINGSTTALDTSIVTAISGSGKQFTIYGKTKSVNGSNVAIFGSIFSGEIDGNVLKNVRMGLINLDNSKGGNAFIKQGEGRVLRDNDLISESIPIF